MFGVIVEAKTTREGPTSFSKIRVQSHRVVVTVSLRLNVIAASPVCFVFLRLAVIPIFGWRTKVVPAIRRSISATVSAHRTVAAIVVSVVVTHVPIASSLAVAFPFLVIFSFVVLKLLLLLVTILGIR